MQLLNGKNILITGAAVRIGRAIAEAFAEQGASVIIHYHNSEEEAEKLCDELTSIGGEHYTIQADLAKSDERDKLIARANELVDGLDCLINNASFYRRCYLRDVEEEYLWRDYNINFVAPFMLMRDYKKTVTAGSIINLLDQRVHGVDPAAGTYGCAKKSLRDVTEGCAVEWAPGIRVNGVAPGVVLPPPNVPEERMKPLLKNIPMQQHSSLQEIAHACLFLTRSETITGEVIYVDGGLHLTGKHLSEKPPAQFQNGR